MDLGAAPEVPADAMPFESVNLDRSEKDNSKWIELISDYLKVAKSLEVQTGLVDCLEGSFENLFAYFLY